MKLITAITLALLLPAFAGAAPDGAKLYEQYCLKCHGAKGAGDGKSAKLFDPRPNDFTAAKWQAKITDEQIFEAVKMGPKAVKIKVGKKMPAFGKKMTDEEIHALAPVLRAFAKK